MPSPGAPTPAGAGGLPGLEARVTALEARVTALEAWQAEQDRCIARDEQHVREGQAVPHWIAP